MFDEGWFFQRLHECVDMLRIPIEEVRDQLDAARNTPMLHLHTRHSDGGTRPIMIAPKSIGALQPRQSGGCWLYQHGSEEPFQIDEEYADVQEQWAQYDTVLADVLKRLQQIAVPLGHPHRGPDTDGCGEHVQE